MGKVKKLRLKPSARDKRRYFIVSVNNKKIEDALLEYIGVLGFAKSSYMKVSGTGIKGKTVGSCLVSSLEDVRAALGLAGIEIIKVSGTIKGLKGKS